MIRYDKQELTFEEKEKKQLETVQIDQEHQRLIVQEFIEMLKNIKYENDSLFRVITDGSIIFHNHITLDNLSSLVGGPVNSYVEFIKNAYTHNLDRFINKVYGKEVIAIQELPFSFQHSDKSDKVILYEFLV